MNRMKPILFSTPMVQAILDNRKRMTRRVIIKKYSNTDIGMWNGMLCEIQNDTPPPQYNPETKITRHTVKACVPIEPKHQVGDILWVRESWRVHENYNGISPRLIPKAMGGDYYGCIDYRANARTEDFWGPWRPSIFMPYQFARIFLRVTKVRAERLQDISGCDAIAEGTPYELCGGWHPTFSDPDSGGPEPDFVEGFKKLWNGLNTDRGYGWDVNPWVWVYEFERVDKP